MNGWITLTDATSRKETLVQVARICAVRDFTHSRRILFGGPDEGSMNVKETLDQIASAIRVTGSKE